MKNVIEGSFSVPYDDVAVGTPATIRAHIHDFVNDNINAIVDAVEAVETQPDDKTVAFNLELTVGEDHAAPSVNAMSLLINIDETMEREYSWLERLFRVDARDYRRALDGIAETAFEAIHDLSE